MLAQPVHSEEYYDPQHTMLALNMAAVSVHRIVSTQDRIILEQEYQNIINNLSIGNIRSDPEITELYKKLLDVAQNKRLRQKEEERLRKNFDSQSRRNIKSALSEMAENSRKMLTGETGISSFTRGLGRLAGACAASYFKYNTGDSYSFDFDTETARLSTNDLADFNDMQKQLLASSWNLLNKYHLPDEFRLVQKAMDDFYSAVDEPDTASRRLRMLKALEDDFRVYPPYWYYCARTALETGDDFEAERSFAKFDEVWRPVLRKDPYKLEVSKYRINMLLKDGLPQDEETRQKALDIADIMRENTMRDDWANNLFAGAVYYALGEKETGILCTQINLDFGYEHELSGAILQSMRLNVPAEVLMSETSRLLKLNELAENVSSSDRRKIFMIADCLDDREGALEALRLRKRTPAETHALRISLQRKAEPPEFAEICALAESQAVSGDEVSRDYAVIMPLLKVYSEDKNALAFIMLADMYLYGWGVDDYPELAKSLYFKAAEKGELYAQAMYVSLILSEGKSFKSEPEIDITPQSADNKPAKNKKPLIRFWPFKW